MYNLFVSGDPEEWGGEPFQIEEGRAVREYTENAITERFGALDAASVDELKLLPCIFAYESSNKKNPLFGVITDVTKRGKDVRIEYKIQPLEPFLTWEDMDALRFELDTRGWEMSRTHWAVKDVNLQKEILRARGIVMPPWASNARKTPNLNTHIFDVALSFPGEVRQYVDQVAAQLEHLIGPDRYFYDNNYVAQLARPNLDTYLQAIYGERSKLIVVFIGADYEKKDWCGIEFRSIRGLVNARDAERVMYVRMDDGNVPGIMKLDGYVDARRFRPDEIAGFIQTRIEHL